MMCNGEVNIKYKGRYGNNLFMYFAARIYAEQHSLNLKADIPDKYFSINEPESLGGNQRQLKNYEIGDDDYDEQGNLPYHGVGSYRFFGLFQKEETLFQNREKILSWVNLDFEKQDTCTIHLRLDDYYIQRRSLVINTDYWIHCIEKHADVYDKINIVCEKPKQVWEFNYLSNLMSRIKELNKKPIYVPGSMPEDIEKIMMSNCIITSNSTFCFWPAFFSKAEKIISFPHTGVDLMADDTTEIWEGDVQVFKHNQGPYELSHSFSDNPAEYFERPSWT
tara:strand:+ start:3548 stop:4381 length:834 start_codon:yes stop_codon:yes gene_type:complete